MLVVRLNRAHHMKHIAEEKFQLLAASFEGKLACVALMS